MNDLCLEYDTVTWQDIFIQLSTVSSHIMSLLYIHFSLLCVSKKSYMLLREQSFERSQTYPISYPSSLLLPMEILYMEARVSETTIGRQH